MVAGGLGALIGETIAETVYLEQAQTLDPSAADYTAREEKLRHTSRDLGRYAAIAAAVIAKCDPEEALAAADRALVWNFTCTDFRSKLLNGAKHSGSDDHYAKDRLSDFLRLDYNSPELQELMFALKAQSERGVPLEHTLSSGPLLEANAGVLALPLVWHTLNAARVSMLGARVGGLRGAGVALAAYVGYQTSQYFNGDSQRDTSYGYIEYPEEIRNPDQGFTAEPSRGKTLETPINDFYPELRGYIPVGSDVRWQDEGFSSHQGPSTYILTRGELPKNLPEDAWVPPQEALDKIPDFLGEGRLNRDGKGYRWLDSNKANYGIRIDKGDPSAVYPQQRIDHVRVTRKGQVIGIDGHPILGSSELPNPKNAPHAHIPLEEWKKWKDGFNK